MNSVENTKNNTQNTSGAEGQKNRSLPKEVTDFLLRKTTATMESDTVKGYDFNKGIDYPEIIKAFAKTGFQSTSVSHAIDIINKMLSWRLSDDPFNPAKDHGNLSNIEVRKSIKCTVFLGYTSNLISSGMRETIRFLVEHKLVSCIVTSGKGIEEDFMKCLAPTHVGDFQADDHKLYEQGVNRIGNLLIPTDNYSKFKDWILPLFDEMLEEQQSKGVTWTPSKLIKRLGEKIDNAESVYYWAAKNDIPVFCTGFTDGILGDMLFMHSSMKKGFVVDIIKDLRKLNKLAMNSRKSGVVVLGGGLVKDHILNSNIVKNGADYTVLISNESEYDSGNSGLHEALSCGKLNSASQYVKVWAESTLVFPIIVAETFAKYYYEFLKAQEERIIEAANENNSENTTSS